MRHALLALLLAAAPAARAAAAITVAPALGGGAEIGSSRSDGVGELEVAVGTDLVTSGVELRPEVAGVLQFGPGTSLGLRPGVRLFLPGGPLYVRAALDLSHASGDWSARWLLGGVGVEARLTSVLSGFAEGDTGIPLDGSGLPLLVRAGVAFRF